MVYAAKFLTLKNKHEFNLFTTTSQKMVHDFRIKNVSVR